MSTDVSPLDARRVREHFRFRVAPERANHARIRADKHLTEDGRRNELARSDAGLDGAHQAVTGELAEMVSTAEAAVVYDGPPEVLARAGARDPAKVAGAAAVAKVADARSLVTMIRTANLARDYLTTGGYALGIRGRADFTADEYKAITDELNGPHLDGAALAVARLVGIKVEAQRHAQEGPTGDSFGTFTRDPMRAVGSLYEAQSYKDPRTGDVVGLSDAQAAALLDATGVRSDIDGPELPEVGLTPAQALASHSAAFAALDAANGTYPAGMGAEGAA